MALHWESNHSNKAVAIQQRHKDGESLCPSQSLSVGVVDDFHRLIEAHLFN